MTAMPLDDYENEGEDYENEDYESEDYESESEGEDFQESRTDARLRRQRAARARQILAAQQRAARNLARRTARPVSPSPVPTSARQTVAAIRNLDLQNKVGEDTLHRKIAQANKRATRSTYATVAGIAMDQAFDTFKNDLEGHKFVRAGLRLVPSMLLSAPPSHRTGAARLLEDPRAIALAALGGVLAVGQFRDRDDDVDRIEIDRTELDTGIQNGQLFALGLNKKGFDTGQEPTWSAHDQSVLQLDTTGRYTIKSPVKQDTTLKVTVKAGSKARTVFLQLHPPAPNRGGGNPAAKVPGGNP